METDSNLLKPWYRRLTFRISVRGLIVLVLIIGGGLGWLGHRARVQREAVAAIERAGGYVAYHQTFEHSQNGILSAPRWPKWLVDLVGIDSLEHVTIIEDNAGFGEEKLGDAELARIGQLDHLEILRLAQSSPTDAGLTHLRGSTRLRELILLGGKLSGSSLAYFSGLSDLRELSFHGERVTDADLARLSSLTHLRKLEFDLDNSTITNDGLACLERLKDLQALSISGFKISDDGLKHLEGFHSLKSLYLDGDNFTNDGLARLGTLRKLDSLGIKNSKVTDLTYLKPLNSLRSLDLSNAPIGDEGLAALDGFLNLRLLSLEGNRKLTDASLAQFVVACPNLEVLILTGTQITDAGMASLLKLKSLDVLYIEDTQISTQAILAAKAAQKGLNVISSNPVPPSPANSAP